MHIDRTLLKKNINHTNLFTTAVLNIFSREQHSGSFLALELLIFIFLEWIICIINVYDV